MIDWQFLIDLQDGNGQRDISDLVKYDTLTRTRRLYNELKSTTWTVSFDLTYNSTLFPLLIAQKDEILIEINRDSTAWFTGFIRPTFKIDSRNIGSSGVGDVVSIEAVDNGYKLDRVHGWNGQDNLDINAGWVSNSANTAQSAVHLILNQAGYSGAEIGTPPTVTGDIQFTIPTSASQGPDQAGGGKTYREYLEKMLFEWGYSFSFTAAGVFELYDWKKDGTVATTDTIGQSEIMTYSLSRDDWRPDRVDVVYTARKTGRATVDATRKAVTTSSSNASGTFSGVVDYSRIQASGWRLTRHSVVLEVQPGPVGSPSGPLYQRVVNTSDTFPVSLIASKTATYPGVNITSFTVDDKGNYSIGWASVGSLIGSVALTLREVQAVFSYPESEGVSSRDVGSEVRPVRVDTDHLETALEAEDLAVFYSQYLNATQTKIRVTCKIPESTGLPEYSLGQYLSLTEPINGISASKVRVVEIVENGFLLTDGSATTYTMSLEPVETISVNTPAAVTNPPPRFNRQPEPEPERGQSSSIIITPPQDGSSWTDFPVQYIEWDPENDTLSVFGDLFLSGNSTVQGTITVGQDLRSDNYVPATSGWIIDGDGDAEFNNVTVRGTIVSSAGTIGGFTIGATSLTAGTGATRISLSTVDGIHLGATAFASAPFRVTLAGAVTATSGTIGGFTLSSTTLTAGSGATRISLDTAAGIHLGDNTFASAPFSVSLAGALKSTSGTIGGFTIGSDRLSSGAAGVARLVMSQADRRFEVVDSSNVVRVAMGYLNALPKNDGSGNFGASDYGFWARSGDELRIDGDAEYTSGDWLIAADASYLIVDGVTPSIVRARLGTISGEQGLHINEANTGANYRARLTASRFFVGNDSTYIDFDAVGGTLTIALASFFVSSLATNVKGELNIGQAGTVTSLTNPIQLSTDGGATLGYINHATSLRLRTAGTDRVTITSTGQINQQLATGATGTIGYRLIGQNSGSISFENGTSASNEFFPVISGRASSNRLGSNSVGMLILAGVDDTTAGGNGFIFRARSYTSTSLSTANVLKIQNNTTDLLTITSTGAVQIAQTLAVGGTTLESGYEFQVNGDGRVTGNTWTNTLTVGGSTLAAGFEAQVNGDLNVTGGVNSTTAGRVFASTLTVGTDTPTSGYVATFTGTVDVTAGLRVATGLRVTSGGIRTVGRVSLGTVRHTFTSDVTQDALYDLWTNKVVDVGDTVLAVGVFWFYNSLSGDYESTRYDIHAIERTGASEITVYWHKDSTTWGDLGTSSAYFDRTSANGSTVLTNGSSTVAFTASATRPGFILV